MTAGATATYLVGQWLLPPISLILLALAGVLLARWRLAAGIGLATASLLALLALSTPFAARALMHSLEPPPLNPAQRAGAQAIVILAGGRVTASPDWDGDT